MHPQPFTRHLDGSQRAASLEADVLTRSAVDWLWKSDNQGVVIQCLQATDGGMLDPLEAPLSVGSPLWGQTQIDWFNILPESIQAGFLAQQPLRNVVASWSSGSDTRLCVVINGDVVETTGGSFHWEGGISVSPPASLTALQLHPHPSTTPLGHREAASSMVGRTITNRIEDALTLGQRFQRHSAVLVVKLHASPPDPALLDKAVMLLETALRPEDVMEILGPDEIGAVLLDLGDTPLATAAAARLMAMRLITALNPSAAGDSQPDCTAGLALVAPPVTHAANVLKQARDAVVHTRWQIAPHVWVSDPNLHRDLTSRVVLESELQHALKADEFVLHYQPVVNVQGEVVGAEALIRWHHPQRGMVSPAHFIPAAEESGLIVQLGRWVLRNACKQLAQWARIPYKANWTIAVNVSAKQFAQASFVDEVLGALSETGANPRRLKLELTESVMVTKVEEAITKMTVLQEQGLKFSLDDFGTGYSSLSYLKRLPLQQLKIDQSFVRDIHKDPNDAAIVKTILALAHSLELSVIAEGVETTEQELFLISAGCRFMQGYLYGKPAPIEQWP